MHAVRRGVIGLFLHCNPVPFCHLWYRIIASICELGKPLERLLAHVAPYCASGLGFCHPTFHQIIERFRELGDCFLVNEELRWAAIDILANDEFKKSGIENSVRVMLAILRWLR